MKTASSVHNSHYNVKKCEKPGPLSKVIVISVNQVANNFDPSQFQIMWKTWQRHTSIANIINDSRGIALFKADNKLAEKFTCQKTYRECGGHPKAKESDFSSGTGLKDLNECMQCSYKKATAKKMKKCASPTRGLRSDWLLKIVGKQGDMSKCGIESEDECKCQSDFKSCEIQPDKSDPESRCLVCISLAWNYKCLEDQKDSKVSTEREIQKCDSLQKVLKSDWSLKMAWEKGGMSACGIESEDECKCQSEFKSCEIQPDKRDPETRCTVCISLSFDHTLRRIGCLQDQNIKRDSGVENGGARNKGTKKYCIAQ